MVSFLALGAVVPRTVHAGATTCSMIAGIYTCSDGSLGNGGNVCVVDTQAGKQTCTSSGGNSVTTNWQNLGTGLGQIQPLPAQVSSTGWLSKFTGWIASVIHTVFVAAVQVLKDLVTYVFAVVLGVIAAAVSVIGVPSFIANYSMNSVLGQAGPIVGFFLTYFQIPTGLSLIGAGYAFRLVRKFLTLFQW